MSAGKTKTWRRVSWFGCMFFWSVFLSIGKGQLMAETAFPSEGPCRDGYRQLGVLVDPTLGKKWLILGDCIYPERPRLAVVLDGQAPDRVDRGHLEMLGSSRTPLRFSLSGLGISVDSRMADGPTFGEKKAELRRVIAVPSLPVLPVIALGAQVRLWRRDGTAVIDLAGIALDGGQEGTEIRVKVAIGEQVLRGVIRGPGSIELTLLHAAGFTGADQ